MGLKTYTIIGKMMDISKVLIEYAHRDAQLNLQYFLISRKAATSDFEEALQNTREFIVNYAPRDERAILYRTYKETLLVASKGKHKKFIATLLQGI
jgi:hypothetical protein